MGTYTSNTDSPTQEIEIRTYAIDEQRKDEAKELLTTYLFSHYKTLQSFCILDLLNYKYKHIDDIRIIVFLDYGTHQVKAEYIILPDIYTNRVRKSVYGFVTLVHRNDQ